MKTKFKVSKNKADRTYGGIVFDSKMEMHYYRDEIVPKLASGTIKTVERQKPYVLQPAYKYNGKAVRQIIYKADFYIEYSNGESLIVEVKGLPTQEAILKRKILHYVYPDVKDIWMTESKKYGGWVEFEQLKKLRKGL